MIDKAAWLRAQAQARTAELPPSVPPRDGEGDRRDSASSLPDGDDPPDE